MLPSTDQNLSNTGNDDHKAVMINTVDLGAAQINQLAGDDEEHKYDHEEVDLDAKLLEFPA